jgi:hypothetical protein
LKWSVAESDEVTTLLLILKTMFSQ